MSEEDNYELVGDWLTSEFRSVWWRLTTRPLPPGPSPETGPPSGWINPATIAVATLPVSFLALIVTAIGTASTVLLGWRNDRRQAEEARLKIQQLERELAKSKEQDSPKRLDTAL